MQQLVDKTGLGSTPGPGAPSTSAPQRQAVGNQSPSGPGDVNKPGRADDRIRELVAEREHWKDQAAQIQARLQSLEQQATQKPQVSQQSSTSPRSWDEVTEQQLEEILTNDSPDITQQTRLQAMKELSSRSAKVVAEKASQEARKQAEREQYRDRVFAGIVEQFGPDARDKSSPLWQAANEQYAHFQRIYGDQVVNAHPEFTELAFLRANEMRMRPELEELQRLRDFKRQVESNRGISAGVAPMAETARDMLSRGDTKGAAGDLALRMFGDVINRRP